MDFDLLVVGGGLVGASFAAALRNSGVAIALVEAQSAIAVPGDESWDPRVYAIGPGSASFLKECGAWQRVDALRIERIEEMQVWGDDGASRLDFSAYDTGLRELAYVVESRRLQQALWNALQESAAVRVYCPAQCAALDFSPDRAELTLQDGTQLRARLVVAADGGDSWVRVQAGIGTAARAYGQTGVVANFHAEKPHRGIAFQWFRRDGVLALLPLPGNRVSMVWSCNDELGARLLGLSAPALEAELYQASHAALGALSTVTPAAGFPLRLQRAARLIAPRIALIGDAAHNVHPLAGQGVNLGFRDARELANVIAGRGAQEDCGDYFLLRRYERARREDILAVEWTTDGLQRLFGASGRLISRVRNLGLRATSGWTQLKNFLVWQAVR